MRNEVDKKLAELMEAARVACERERREESDLTPEEFANRRTDPQATERRRRTLIRNARAGFVERREQSKRNK